MEGAGTEPDREAAGTGHDAAAGDDAIGPEVAPVGTVAVILMSELW